MSVGRNRRIRNRTYGGVGGRRGRPRLLPDSASPNYIALVGAAPRGEWRPSSNTEPIPKSFAPRRGSHTSPANDATPCRSGAPPRTMAAPQVSSRPQQLRPEAGLPRQSSKRRAPPVGAAPRREQWLPHKYRAGLNSFAPRRGSHTSPANDATPCRSGAPPRIAITLQYRSNS